MSCKAMPECMATRRLQNARFLDRHRHSTLHGSLVNMVSNRLPCIHVSAKRARRKNILPTPLAREGRIFARERRRQRYPRLTRPALLLEADVQFGKMNAQRTQNGGRQDRHTILAAFCVANNELTTLNHQILTRRRNASINRKPLPS